jgi:hypothetical protein
MCRNTAHLGYNQPSGCQARKFWMQKVAMSGPPLSLLQGVTVDKAVAGAIDAGLQEDGSVKESVSHLLGHTGGNLCTQLMSMAQAPNASQCAQWPGWCISVARRLARTCGGRAGGWQH